MQKYSAFLSLFFYFISIATVGAKTTYNPAPALNNEADLSNQSLIILNALQTQAGHVPAEEAGLDLTPKKVVDTEPVPEPTPTPGPTPEPSPTPSAGKQKIEEMLRKNRQQLQGGPGQTGQGANIVEQMKAANRSGIKDEHQQAAKADELSRETEAQNSGSMQDLKRQALFNLNQLKTKNKKTLSQFKKQTKQTYARWAMAQKEFIKKMSQYKNASFDIKTFSPENLQSAYKQIGKKSISEPVDGAKIQFKKFHILPRALELPIRDQGPRPTCAAFAGVRALEVLLAGHQQNPDLSEQYFYWASKPQCQQSPCKERGSWVLSGYRYSMEANTTDIPEENDCPYQPDKKSSNETQLPMRTGCLKGGVVKVESFRPLAGYYDVVDALQRNQPVVGGLKLSPNFYTTQGLIKYSDRYVGGSTDGHAAGHAVLFIGHMELPASLQNEEGRHCLIISNSWGEGWGSGGHACVTEKWFEQYHIPNAFMAVESVATNK